MEKIKINKKGDKEKSHLIAPDRPSWAGGHSQTRRVCSASDAVRWENVKNDGKIFFFSVRQKKREEREGVDKEM